MIWASFLSSAIRQKNDGVHQLCNLKFSVFLQLLNVTSQSIFDTYEEKNWYVRDCSLYLPRKWDSYSFSIPLHNLFDGFWSRCEPHQELTWLILSIHIHGYSTIIGHRSTMHRHLEICVRPQYHVTLNICYNRSISKASAQLNKYSWCQSDFILSVRHSWIKPPAIRT